MCVWFLKVHYSDNGGMPVLVQLLQDTSVHQLELYPSICGTRVRSDSITYHNVSMPVCAPYLKVDCCWTVSNGGERLDVVLLNLSVLLTRMSVASWHGSRLTANLRSPHKTFVGTVSGGGNSPGFSVCIRSSIVRQFDDGGCWCMLCYNGNAKHLWGLGIQMSQMIHKGRSFLLFLMSVRLGWIMTLMQY